VKYQALPANQISGSILNEAEPMKIPIWIMKNSKLILAYLVLILAASCIDPYVPNLTNFKSLLVVEGLITDEDRAYEIRLSRTYNHADSIPELVDDAVVFITDDNGVKNPALNTGNGLYKTDSTLFRGIAGRKYTLHIILPDGTEYASDECSLSPVAGIDSIYYEKGEEVSGDPGKIYTGLKILLNTKNIEGPRQYFRWSYEEDWKFNIPYPPQYTYTWFNDTMVYFNSAYGQSTDCWKKNDYNGIIINTSLASQNPEITGQEILFISPALSDRLSLEYSILVTQYSLSEKEYNFWKMLRQVQEPGGDIFGAQPYPNISNVSNVRNPGEEVLGYFEVSAVARKRIFITADDLLSLGLPVYNSDCKAVRVSPDDWHIKPQPSWDEIYHSWVDMQHFQFVGPEVIPGTVIPGLVNIKQLLKFVFTTPECAACELPGSPRRPDFWIDLK